MAAEIHCIQGNHFVDNAVLGLTIGPEAKGCSAAYLLQQKRLVLPLPSENHVCFFRRSKGGGGRVEGDGIGGTGWKGGQSATELAQHKTPDLLRYCAHFSGLCCDEQPRKTALESTNREKKLTVPEALFRRESVPLSMHGSMEHMSMKQYIF